jgi:hypothetical protein
MAAPAEQQREQGRDDERQQRREPGPPQPERDGPGAKARQQRHDQQRQGRQEQRNPAAMRHAGEAREVCMPEQPRIGAHGGGEQARRAADPGAANDVVPGEEMKRGLHRCGRIAHLPGAVAVGIAAAGDRLRGLPEPWPALCVAICCASNS